MAKNDQQECYERGLSASHGRMLDLVKFAEAKNAALLTFCSVWMGYIITLLQSPDEPPMGYRAAFLVTLPLLAAAAVITLTSFLPKLLHHFHKGIETTNLLYFGDIAKLGPDEFREAVRTRYFPTDGESMTDQYLNDLAVQTAVQAAIANRKFRTFTLAGRLALVSFFCMAVPPVVWAFITIWEAMHNFWQAAN